MKNSLSDRRMRQTWSPELYNFVMAYLIRLLELAEKVAEDGNPDAVKDKEDISSVINKLEKYAFVEFDLDKKPVGVKPSLFADEAYDLGYYYGLACGMFDEDDLVGVKRDYFSDLAAMRS